MRKIDWLLILMVIVVIVFMFFVVKFMTDERSACLNDPVGYFEEINEGAYCNCWKDGKIYKKFRFNLNEG